MLVLRLVGLMGLLNVAVMRVLVATPVTTGFLAKGAVAVTLGASLTNWPTPKIGSLLPPQAAMTRDDQRASHHGRVRVLNVEVRIKGAPVSMLCNVRGGGSVLRSVRRAAPTHGVETWRIAHSSIAQSV